MGIASDFKSIIEAKIGYNKKQLNKFIAAKNNTAITDYRGRIHTLQDVLVTYEEQSNYATKWKTLPSIESEYCPICGGETHRICYDCTNKLCSPLNIEL